ncbi:MAG: DUF4143 domain-containing protein [Bacilli bacterium]|nr:DUF4143 domain-containing protein [Bacilli bacterium]
MTLMSGLQCPRLRLGLRKISELLFRAVNAPGFSVFAENGDGDVLSPDTGLETAHIIVHNDIRNENGIKLMIKKIAESIKQDLSFTKIQNIITGIGYKISKDIIIDYCGYCKDAFLFFTLENYYASFLDKNSNPKYYFMDNGILNLFIDNKKSSLIENLVALKLYRHHKNNLYYLKGNKIDIDFYLSDSNTVIQVAYSLSEKEVYDRETKNLIEFARNNKKKTNLIIVTYEEEKVIDIDGYKINVFPLAKYLLLK